MTGYRLFAVIIVSAIAIAFPLAILLNRIQREIKFRKIERAIANAGGELATRAEFDAINAGANIVPMICKPNQSLKRKGSA